MAVEAAPDVIIDLSSNGTVINGPSNNQAIRIHSLVIVGQATITLKAGTRALTGAMVLPAGNPVLVLPFSKDGWFTLRGGEAFNIDTNAQISGCLNCGLIG